MTFHKHKDKIIRGLAILMASLMILGALAPVVFAEGSNGQPIEKTEEKDPAEKEEEEKEEEKEEEEEEPIQWGIKPYPKSQDYDPKKPASYYTRFNENTLFHDVSYGNVKELYYDDAKKEKRLFIKIEFTVDEGEIGPFNIGNLYNGISIQGEGSSTSVVDQNFITQIESMTTENETTKENDQQKFVNDYIFIKNSTDKKKATLYVPIKPLMSNMRYNVILNPGVVGIDSSSTTRPDSSYKTEQWSFYTMAVPSVGADDIEVQTIVEDYDINEPITIEGKFFYSDTIKVYFNDISAYRVRVKEEDHETDKTKNKTYLEVYLPRGRNKLEAGLYSITIENSDQHVREVYGALSVIQQSKGNIPEERKEFGITTPYGEIYGLKSGESVRLDHKEPFKEEILRRSLSGYSHKSPMVEISSGSGTSTFSVQIPVDIGQYENYRVLRYNEISRVWEEEKNYFINEIDQRIDIIANKAGIYVVVEPKY